MNWKDATSVLKKHELSDCHREAVDLMITTLADVAELMQANLAKEI